MHDVREFLLVSISFDLFSTERRNRARNQDEQLGCKGNYDMCGVVVLMLDFFVGLPIHVSCLFFFFEGCFVRLLVVRSTVRDRQTGLLLDVDWRNRSRGSCVRNKPDF